MADRTVCPECGQQGTLFAADEENESRTCPSGHMWTA
jgi:hypothetical protein